MTDKYVIQEYSKYLNVLDRICIEVILGDNDTKINYAHQYISTFSYYAELLFLKTVKA